MPQIVLLLVGGVVAYLAFRPGSATTRPGQSPVQSNQPPRTVPPPVPQAPQQAQGQPNPKDPTLQKAQDYYATAKDWLSLGQSVYTDLTGSGSNGPTGGSWS